MQGDGSIFTVSWWTLRVRNEEDAVIEASAAPMQMGFRILVVDDNVDAAESLAMLLTASGYDVRLAHTGPTAVAAAIEL